MIKWTKSCLFLLLFVGILQNFFNLNSSTILAQGTETTHLTQTSSGKDGNNPSFASSALAEESLTEAIWFGSVEEVTIATRRKTPISKAPSIVTVITAEEIKNLGYRTFAEILRIVPGFEILKFADFGIVGPSVRGLATSSNLNRIRLMLDGHFVNDPLRGGAFTVFDDFPVENIKRIEIIRGPGSAVYGENAFSGVINIITKDAKDIDGVRVSSGYGSFDTYDENILFGKAYGEFGISGMARYRQTSGFDGIVERDRQTTLDNAFTTPPFPDASQAPGKVHDGRQEYDMNLKVSYKDFYFLGWYSNKNREPFVGPQFALTDGSHLESNHVFGEVGYKKTIEEKLTIKPRIYYDQMDSDSFIKSLPENATILDTAGIPQTFPKGFIGNGEAYRVTS